MLIDDIQALYERVNLLTSKPEASDMVEFVCLRNKFVRQYHTSKVEQLHILDQLAERIRTGTDVFDPSIFLSVQKSEKATLEQMGVVKDRLRFCTEGLAQGQSPLRTSLLADNITQLRCSLHVMWCLEALRADRHVPNEPPRIQPAFDPKALQDAMRTY